MITPTIVKANPTAIAFSASIKLLYQPVKPIFLRLFVVYTLWCNIFMLLFWCCLFFSEESLLENGLLVFRLEVEVHA